MGIGRRQRAPLPMHALCHPKLIFPFVLFAANQP